MRIAIIGWAMTMSPTSLQMAGLGGSETAQLCAANALAQLGCEVTCVARLPSNQSGYLRDGVLWMDFADWSRRSYVGASAFDLIICCRRPDLIDPVRHRAARKVLWVQDFADQNYPEVYRDHLAQFQEVWYVSDWQRRQWQRVAGLPAAWVTRNGVAPVTVENPPQRLQRQLLFASRPERGLLPLVRPGGIMDRLEDFSLIVCGYDDTNDSNRAFYEHVWAMADASENVDRLGSLAQHKVRRLMMQSAALVLPTNYAETSMMTGLEAVERLTPLFYSPQSPNFSTTGSGAVSETVGDCGYCIHSLHEWNSDDWCADWADAIRDMLKLDFYNPIRNIVRRNMLGREDMQWSGIVREWLRHAEETPTV